MRIAQINTVFGHGSTGRIAAQIHSAVQARGGDAIAFYGRGDGGGISGAHRFGSQAELMLQGVETRLADRHGLGTHAGTRQLLRALDEFKPDLVQLHNLHGYYVNYPMLIRHLRQLGVATVWTLHDAWSFTGHCTHFDRIGCDLWRTTCHHCPQLHEYPASRGLDHSAANQLLKRDLVESWEELTVVTPSAWLGGLAGQASFAGRRIEVIENDPDFSLFYPRTSDFRERHGLQDAYVVLAVAGVWENRKGLHVLRDAQHLLRPDERLVVIGRLLDESELPTDCLYLEHTEDANELAEIYSAADVYVNPTLEDTYPTTNLEAMACGTPCVTFPTGGSPETIARGRGITTVGKTPQSIRHALDQLRGTAPLAVRFDREGPTMPEHYVRLYETLLGVSD